MKYPDEYGRFGEFGGKYVPETLMKPLYELEEALKDALSDSSFQQQYHQMLQKYSGRPTALTFADQLTKHVGGANIF